MKKGHLLFLIFPVLLLFTTTLFAQSSENNSLRSSGRIVNTPRNIVQEPAPASLNSIPAKPAATSAVVFAHMVNTTNAVAWAMGKGVNGVEMDLRFDAGGNPTEFRHGGVCDCSCVVVWGSDMVCSALNASCNQCPCNAKENAAVLVSFLASFPGKLAVVYIDSKVDGGQGNLTNAGTNVIKLIDVNLFAKGYTGQVVIGTPEAAQIEYTKAAVAAANASPNKAKYFFTIDGEGKKFMTAMQPLIPLTMNRVYSTGISACAPGTYYDAITMSAYNQAISVLGSTGIWTLDKLSSMKEYIQYGANAIMTNYPSDGIRAFAEAGIPLAKPGLALQTATSNALTDKIGAGYLCNSNSNCANGACGRLTAADGARLVCCPSGGYTTYGGYDYCTGMPDGSVCWSDAMCAAKYCRGNNGGLNKGICGKLPVNARCSKNAECANGACGRPTAADGAQLVCCPSGNYTTYAGYDYCTGMPNGSVCWSDAMCASGNCKGNMSGLRKGVCR